MSWWRSLCADFRAWRAVRRFRRSRAAYLKAKARLQQHEAEL